MEWTFAPLALNQRICFYTRLYDITVPSGLESKALGDNRIRQMKEDLAERLATEHTDITDESGAEELRHLPGQCSVLYKTGTSGISALSSNSGGICYDEQLRCLVHYSTSWGNLLYAGDKIFSGTDTGDGDEYAEDGYVLTADGEGGAAWEEKAGLGFLTTYTNIVSWTEETDWTNVDISSYVGSVTAKAALVNVRISFTTAALTRARVIASFRKDGSEATSALPRLDVEGYDHHGLARVNSGMFIVECEENIFEAKLDNDETQGNPTTMSLTVDLIGYFA